MATPIATAAKLLANTDGESWWVARKMVLQRHRIITFKSLTLRVERSLVAAQ